MTRFTNRLAAAWPPERWSDVSVLIAVSGGADSVALARLLANLRIAGAGEMVIAHFNHGLRGAESDADEHFVGSLAQDLGWKCEIGRSPIGSTGDPESKLRRAASEDQSRTARYAFLLECAQRHGARFVVTAHTADDQAETVLHRLLRGTGIAGLGGMRPARELVPGIALVRPLLKFRRAELREYLVSIEQPYREDSSNASLDYTRNRLRNDLMPKLAQDYNPRVVEALLRLSQLSAEAQEIVAASAADLLSTSLLIAERSRIELNAPQLAQAPVYLVREALIIAWQDQGWPLQGMGYETWELLAAMVTGQGGDAAHKHVLPGEILAERAGDRLILLRPAQ